MTAEPRLFRSVPTALSPERATSLQRADILVDNLDQAGPSFELRVFVNNPDADAATDSDAQHGYVGSIHIYGFGQPPPGVETATPPRIPMSRSIPATDAVRAAAAQNPDISITLVPVHYGADAAEIDLSPVRVAVVVDGPPAEP